MDINTLYKRTNDNLIQHGKEPLDKETFVIEFSLMQIKGLLNVKHDTIVTGEL
jgi:hypothetical protein